MKNLLYVALATVLLISCGNNQKNESEASSEAPQIDSVITSRVEVVKAKLPILDGRLGIEECKYDGKTVVLRVRALDDDPKLISAEMVKWIPAMMLNKINEIDTLMIKRLVEMNQPLTYELYDNANKVLVKKFSLTAKDLKSRAEGTNMF